MPATDMHDGCVSCIAALSQFGVHQGRGPKFPVQKWFDTVSLLSLGTERINMTPLPSTHTQKQQQHNNTWASRNSESGNQKDHVDAGVTPIDGCVWVEIAQCYCLTDNQHHSGILSTHPQQDCWPQILCRQLCLEGDVQDTPDRCPGVCPALHTCGACVSHGRGANLTNLSPQRRVHVNECSWCVKEAKCQTRSGMLICGLCQECGYDIT